jgi:protein AATF/BFR2
VQVTLTGVLRSDWLLCLTGAVAVSCCDVGCVTAVVLCREAAAVRAEGEQQLMAAAAAGGDRQAAKAAGVRAQQRLWGNALELRIRLQKAVNGANRLPRPPAAAAFKSSSKQVAAGYKQLRAACQETLESMLQLHDALAQQHPAAAAALAAAPAAKQQEQQPAAAAAGSKRSRAAAGADESEEQDPDSKYAGVCSSAASAWSAVEGAIEGMAGFRDASLDKWHRRTVLSSGTAALRGSSGLRALQQSISTQVCYYTCSVAFMPLSCMCFTVLYSLWKLCC